MNVLEIQHEFYKFNVSMLMCQVELDYLQQRRSYKYFYRAMQMLMQAWKYVVYPLTVCSSVCQTHAL